jgi:hypothetical protein
MCDSTGTQQLERNAELVTPQRCDQQRVGFEGHGLRFDPGHGLEQLGGEVLGAAHDDRADVELAGVLSREREHVRERVESRLRRGDEPQLEEGRRGYHRDVLHHVVGQLLEERYADGRSVAGLQQRVAIGARIHDRHCGRDPARSRPIVDHDLLSHAPAHLLREKPHADIADTPGAHTEHEADGPDRVSVRGRGAAAKVPCHPAGEQQESEQREYSAVPVQRSSFGVSRRGWLPAGVYTSLEEPGASRRARIIACCGITIQ